MSMDKSSNGDQNFYPHKSEMVGKNVKDDVNMSKINSTMTKGECLPDPCDVVCSLSTSDEDTDDTSNKVVTVDDPRMDWLMFKYKKPADGMLPTHMEKGIKSFAYYLFLVAFLWILWPHENEFIYWSRRESFETNIKSLVNYENVKALKVKDMKWKYKNVNTREEKLKSQHGGHTFDDANVSNYDDKFDVKSLKHLKFDVENKKLNDAGIYSKVSAFTNKFKFVDNDDETNLNVKQPVQKVVPDGNWRPILKHSMEKADHNVFFDVDADTQTRKKMFLKVIDDVMEQVEEIMKLRK